MMEFGAIEKLARYARGIFGLSGKDVIVASFPKSGNTWIRFLFCNVINLCERNGETVDFEVLNRTMPELGVDDLMKPWSHPSIPRIVKTHLKYNWLFRGKRSILVARDPRDVMVSYYRYESGKKNPRFRGSFPDFIRDEKLGLEQWFKHCLSWGNHYTVLVRYEDLQRDDLAEFNRILDNLGIHVDAGLVKQAVTRARFDKVHEMEKAGGKAIADRFKAGFTFTRSGKSGSWKDMFNDEDLEYFDRLKLKYDAPAGFDNWEW